MQTDFDNVKFLSFYICIGTCTYLFLSLNVKHCSEIKVMLSCDDRETATKCNVGHFKYVFVTVDHIKLHSVWLLSFPENGWTVRFLIFPVFKSYFLKRCTNLQVSNPDIIVLTAFFNLLGGSIWEMHLEAQNPFYIEFNITIILGRDRNNLESKMCDKFYFIYLLCEDH